MYDHFEDQCILPAFFIFILVAKIRDYFTDLQSTNNDEWVIQ